MIKLSHCLFLLFLDLFVQAQSDLILKYNPENENTVITIGKNQYIGCDSLISIISRWNQYPDLNQANRNFIFYYDDPFFNKVPLRVFIPQTYRSNEKCPLVLLLHGALQISSFEKANKYHEEGAVHEEEDDNDLFFKYLSKKGFIILRPFGDEKRKFSWIVNEFVDPAHSTEIEGGVNLTYRALVNAIIQLKRMLNIDDSRIYSLGHSDGSDGTFCMELFQPTLFAGFVLYNSLMSNIYASNIYLRNVINRPMYIVHSDLDDIRPIQQTRAIVNLIRKANKADSTLFYKEYAGYRHFDKHLVIDLPFANQFLLQTVRNPYSRIKHLESNNLIDNQCDWIKVNSFDLTLPKSAWQVSLNLNSFNKNNKTWMDFPYYHNTESFAIQASFENNIFTIETSRVKTFEILISENMVDLKKPIKVYVNGKLAYDEIVAPDRKFTLRSFAENFDRQAIWVNSVKINCQY